MHIVYTLLAIVQTIIYNFKGNYYKFFFFSGGNMYKIAIDAMGGDNAPNEIIKGALDARREIEGIEIVLLGQKEVIERELAKHGEKAEVIDCPEVIHTGDKPLVAIRTMRNSSLIQGLLMVKDKSADAFVSAGSTGAVFAGALFNVGRIKGIDRPALAALLPTKEGKTMLLDIGANADCKDKYLIQFARMGRTYMKLVEGIENPRVGLINIGAEEEKGNELYREVHQMMKKDDNLNFIGNVEPREALNSAADVLVCDGFTGNVLLKTLEGMATYLFKNIKLELMRNLKTKIAAAILKKGFLNVKSKLDHKEYGGTPLLGVQGCVIKAHGSSDAYSFKRAIVQAKTYLDNDITNVIKDII